MSGRAIIEFEEHGSLRENDNPYELRIRIKIENREIFNVPYVSNSLDAIKGMASDISLRLEARGYKNINLIMDLKNIKIKSIPLTDTR